MSKRRISPAICCAAISMIAVVGMNSSGRAAPPPQDGSLGPVRGPTRPENETVFGAGVLTCREWRTPSPGHDAANIWLEGYWSALNIAFNRSIGGDQREIISRVVAMCVRSPSQKIYIAAIGAWVRAKNGDAE